jgi:F-type H+-transporting ATPase subunit b
MKRPLLLALLAGVALWAQEKSGVPDPPPLPEKAAVEEESAAHEENGDPLAVWKWINFLLLAAGLGYGIAKVVPPIFRSRSAALQKGIAEAQAIKAGAEKRAAAIDARMNSLGTEIENLRTQSKAEMQQEGERIRKETAVAFGKIEQQAAFEIESAGKLAQKNLKEYAAGLALDMAEQRIRARMNDSSEAALIDGFVKDLGRLGSKNYPGLEN